MKSVFRIRIDKNIFDWKFTSAIYSALKIDYFIRISIELSYLLQKYTSLILLVDSMDLFFTELSREFSSSCSFQ